MILYSPSGDKVEAANEQVEALKSVGFTATKQVQKPKEPPSSTGKTPLKSTGSK